MFKDVLNHAHLASWAEMGLIIFFVVFVGITIWTMTVPKSQADRWAELPLHGDKPGDSHE